MITKKTIEGASAVTVIGDNSISGNNVCCTEKNHGREVNIEEKEDRIYLHLTNEATDEFALTATPAVGPTMLVMANDQMGRGKRELGSILIGRSLIPSVKFHLYTIAETMLPAGRLVAV